MSKSKQRFGVGFDSLVTRVGIFVASSILPTLAACGATSGEPTADDLMGIAGARAGSASGEARPIAAPRPALSASNAHAQQVRTVASASHAPAFAASNRVSDLPSPLPDGATPVPIVSSSASSYYDWRWPTTATYDGDTTTFWMTAGNSLHEGKDYMPWIEYTFDQVYSLGSMRVINFDGYEYLRAAKDVEVLVSQDGETFTSLGYKQLVLGSSTTIDGTLITQGAIWQSFDLGGALAKYVKLAIHTNYYGWTFYASPDLDGGTWGWANASITGLRETQFYATSGDADCSSSSTSCTVRPVALTIPQSTTLSALALFGNSVILDSGVHVASSSTRQAAAIAGGLGGVSIGAQSVVGGVTSNGNVSIASGVQVSGPVLAAGTVANASTLVNAVKFEQNTGPLPVTQQVLSVPWPTVVGSALTVSNGQSLSHLPGYYGSVTVADGGTLQLLSGDHYMDSLTVESGGHLVISNTAAAVRIFLRGALTFSGDLAQESNDANVIFISSAPTVNLSSSLRATVWAPNAQLKLAAGGVFTGSFIGDVVHVGAGAMINLEPTFQQPVVAYGAGSPGGPDQCVPGGDFFKTYELPTDGTETTLENTKEWICLLTSISGAGIEARVVPRADYWTGYASGYGTATCLHKSCFSSNQLKFNGSYYASAVANNDYVPPGLPIPGTCDGATGAHLAGESDEATFIADFSSNASRGGGEKFRVEQSSTTVSYVYAYQEECPGWLNGQGYSLRAGPLGQPALFDGPNASRARIETAGKVFLDSGRNTTGLESKLLAPVSDAVCYLSSISGQFAGGGEGISLDAVPDSRGALYWRLLVRHQSGGAPGGVQAEATCYARDQDACSSSDGSIDPAICDPLVRQRFEWSQWAAPHVMGTASDRACFLTALSGDFQGGGEQIAITQSSGVWQLSGKSQQQGVYGQAQCVAGQASNEVAWNNSMERANLGPVELSVGAGPAQSRACFLTAFSGRLGGGGESVHVYQEDGSWWLDGTTQQGYITASARCMAVASVEPEQVWNQGNPPKQLTGLVGDPDPRSVCFLTGVRGRFNGNGEYARVTVEPGASGKLVQWLGGESQQVGVESRAVCVTLQEDPQAGPPEPDLTVPPDCSLSSSSGGCSGFEFATRIAGAAPYGSDDEHDTLTTLSCRPLSCFQSGAPDSIAAVSPVGSVSDFIGEACSTPRDVPLQNGDSVAALYTFYARNGSGAPATHGNGEWALVTQSTDANTPSRLAMQNCSPQDTVLECYGNGLLLNSSHSPVKFIGSGDLISTYDPAIDDFKVDSAGTASFTMSPVATSTCVFTRAQGNFIGSGEYISIDPTDVDGTERWVLNAHHTSGTGVSATARCFPNNQSDQ